jgi:hypothetical protein
MKYVLLGNLSPEWANKQSDRVGQAKAKLDKLGIKIESIHYTQGYYDFVLITASVLWAGQLEVIGKGRQYWTTWRPTFRPRPAGSVRLGATRDGGSGHWNDFRNREF